MNTSIDGADSLTQQTLDVRAAENSGFLLLSIAPDLEKPTWNNLVLRRLTAAEHAPNAITITSAGLPAGNVAIWMGIIYADGELAPSIAYRS